MNVSPGDPAVDGTLRHVLVAGGTPSEWAALSEREWDDRLSDLGKAADHAGTSWLTVRPFGPDTGALADGSHGPVRRSMTVGGCVVVAEPEPDGRARLVAAIASLAARGAPITEDGIVGVLDAPAAVDPDLVVVLGPPNRLPPSLVWELAYAELVFLDVAWADLQVTHLGEALVAFAGRRRRFGGLD